VILQLGAIYSFHRKLFAMSPLHHHFELKGMSETHIVARFAMLHIVSMALFFALFQNFVL
ncbi:MAG TPA: phospho-N-acetylmuramoyl-pentapeptide-transferase, partial [Synergistaceae bacterium]|nr:phospho-N-acetylmuramoyl-pentapeptide-transferase [Synergistaceae bacterium]